jgi:hypothetical protein
MKLFLFYSVLVLALSSCVKNNADPSWLEVNEWTLESNPNSANDPGALTHNFTDVLLYVDDKRIGFFEVPFKIPLLLEGVKKIRVYPTIKNNGISATKKEYPFVNYYEINAELIKNQTLTVNPVTKYISNTKFWIEDFEDAAVKIEHDPSSNAQINQENDPAILRWGNFYGHVHLTELDSMWVAITNGNIPLPKQQEVYLEIDYHTTNTILTGLVAISSTQYTDNLNILLTSQAVGAAGWKKIYIDLRELVSFSTFASYYEISLKAALNEGLSSSDIYMDNIKLVYF